ncbi:MAG: phenylalanine--tRNA ligase subunit beta [Candidatus Omnitrophica bacterium]|nr:phenylalanine--tRNA ligase subunit beta [Candidatus Omnitrophota bacterium]
MKIPYSWLKEYVGVKFPADRLAHVLTMAGLSVESVKPAGDDHILEIEITANRPDWLSVIGVAREVAALTGSKLKLPVVSKAKGAKPGAAIRVKVSERSLCPRYTARVVRNVRVGKSPEWLKARIEAMGLRSVNNIVDITNFCMFETGEPMHAFDLDKISGSEVIIRRAAQGEKIVSIEGTEKTLDTSMLVIADNRKPIAIAGIIGGANTEVTDSTRNILLEAAFFDQVSVRRASRKLAIATESSYRFERRVDADNIVYASDRALGLILKLAGGEAGAFIDIGAKVAGKKAIGVRADRANALLGTDISDADIGKIMTSLGMKVKLSAKGSFKVDVPSFRYDLKAEVDIIEEIARIYGYDRIPATLPKLVEQPMRMDRDVAVRDRIRECLTALGADEIITYSLLGRKAIAASQAPVDLLATIANPLTSEQEAMRPSLIPGMLGAMMWNINRKTKDLKLFEIGNVYFLKDGKFGENRRLSIGIAGGVFASWTAPARQASFFELKGLIETLFSELGVDGAGYESANTAGFVPGECAQISVGGHPIGAMGRMSAGTLHNFDIKDKVYALEIDLDVLLKHIRLEKHFEEPPKYPPALRDISLLAPREALNADLMAGIKKAAGALLKDVTLIDRYEGKQIPADKVSLTYRLEYRDPARTLEEKDVLDVHGRILRELEEKFGAKPR